MHSGKNITTTHLLVEDGLRLTTVTRLLTVVTTLSLRGQRILALLVLGHLVGPARRSKRVRISQALSRQESKERLTCASGTACPCSLQIPLVNVLFSAAAYLFHRNSQVRRVLGTQSYDQHADIR